MEETQIVQERSVKNKIPVSIIVLLSLLTLRIPFLAGLEILYEPRPAWLVPVFENGTFILTALLIWLERKRLEQFHIGYGALGIFIIGPFVYAVLVLSPVYPYHDARMIINRAQLLTAVLLLAALCIWRPKLSRITLKSVLWIPLSLFIGLAFGALYGYVNSIVLHTPRVHTFALPILIINFVRQTTWAATLEEPLFRGFLWGFLKNAGWKDIWICVFQAGLFMVAHSYYLKENPIIFFNVFIVAFILGIVVWKSRSIANSMTIHGLFNSVGEIVQYFRF